MKKLILLVFVVAASLNAQRVQGQIGQVPVVAAADNSPVGGAGNLTTVGAVPYVSATGILNQTPTQFFWDATNNRLGIGTATPTLGKLQVAIATDATVAYFSNVKNNAGSSEMVVMNDDRGFAGVNSGRTLVVRTRNDGLNDTGAITSFETTGGSTIYALWAGINGNVGMGTATPVYGLDVARSGASGTAQFYDQTATTGATRVVITRGAADTTSTQVFEIGGLMKFSGLNSTGAGSALLGTNSPATTNTAPYTWLKVLTSDGSTGYVPVWK